MAIKFLPETYENASEILSKTELKLHSVMNNIKYVYDNLDSQINSYIGRDLLSIKSNIDDVNYKSHELSIKIKEKIEDFKSVEKKTEKSLQAIGTIGGALIGNSAFGTAGAIAGTIAGHTLGKNIINNTDISSQTAAVITEAAAAVGDFFSSIKDTLGAAVEDIQESISNTASKVATSTKSAFDWVVDKAKEVGDFVWHSITHPVETLKKTGASIANTVVGLVQGLGEFGEALVDTATILGSIATSPYTLLVDGFQWIGGKITGNENWSSVTKSLWSETMDFVSTKYVTNAFDSFHQNNAIGKWLDENAYSPFKSTGAVYKVADGVGYIGGIILLTLATMGIGGAVAGAGAGGAGAATSGTIATINIGNVATISVTQQAVTSGAIAATAGFGKNTQNAWADGANLGEGLAYGTAMGLWEGAEMIIGAEINTLKFPGLSGLKGQLITTGSHVALDTIDGGSAGLINPMMQMIYNPNEKNMAQIMYLVNYDENGNQISNKTWDELSFSEKYQAMFKYNGGWGAVGTQALSAGAMSFLTEIPDIKAAVPLSQGDAIKLIGDLELKNGVELFTLEELDDIIAGKITVSSKELDDILAKKLTAKGISSGYNPSQEVTLELETVNNNLSSELKDYLEKYLIDPSVTAPTGIPKEIIEYLDEFSKNPTATLPMDVPQAVYDFLSSKGKVNIDIDNPTKPQLTTSTVNNLSQETINFNQKIDAELKALNPMDSNYNQKYSLIQQKAQIEETLMNIAHNKGMTLDDYIKTLNQSSNIDPNIQQLALDRAKIISNQAKQAEPSITAMMKSLEDNQSHLVGLEHRFKTEDSIARKIINWAKYGNCDASSINYYANSINDSLRYTLILDESTYSNGVYSSLKKLMNNGYQVEAINNSWGSSTYQGLNVTLRDASGLRIEVQFHTEGSFITKETMNHVFYEIARSPGATSQEKQLANQIMQINQSLNVNTINDMVGLTQYDIIEKAKLFDISPLQQQAKKYTNYQDFVKHYQADRDAWVSSLSPQEKSLINAYIGENVTSAGNYKAVNGILRGTMVDTKKKIISWRGTGGYLTEMSFKDFESSYGMSVDDFVKLQTQAAEDLNRAISRMTLNEPTILTRGVNWDALSDYGIKQGDSAQVIMQKLYAKGNVYSDPGFMSSSPVPSYITSSKPIQLVMECDAGTKCADLSLFNAGEKEVLFGAGQKFSIQNVTDENGVIMIYLKTI